MKSNVGMQNYNKNEFLSASKCNYYLPRSSWSQLFPTYDIEINAHSIRPVFPHDGEIE